MHTALIHALSFDQRRVFNRSEAASYLGVSRGYFDKQVRLGKLPAPLPFPGVKRWDKGALDDWLNKASGRTTAAPVSVSVSAYDEWSSSRGAR